MADLREMQVAMDGRPAANLEVIEAEFIFLFTEALLDRPARIGDVQQPFQR